MKSVSTESGRISLSNWTFYTGVDLNTTGNVFFQTEEQAQQQQVRRDFVLTLRIVSFTFQTLTAHVPEPRR